jgi:3-hydroxyacyl-CoA dehydrogenase
MSYRIERAAVIGAGTMGAAIAALLANAGLPVDLLDVVPQHLTPEEEAQGLTLSDPAVRNRVASAGLARARTASPPAFVDDAAVERVRIGNVEDDLVRLRAADWIIEAIIEQREPKQALMARLEQVRHPRAIVSSNTSGIPIAEIGTGRSAAFRAHLLGTHFFNPPRYLKLLEVIPTADTAPDVTAFISRFASERLGKGVVLCKDTPNFVANRLGSMWRAFDVTYALEHGYTVEEVDTLLGPLIGRPRTGIFRLLDLVGLDVAMSVRRNLYAAIPQDEEREILVAPRYVALTDTMLQRGMLGNKTGRGFYQAVQREGKREFWVLDLETLDYRPPRPVDIPSVLQAQQVESLPERLRLLVAAADRGGAYLRHSLGHNLAYAARRVPEIAERFIELDRACRWGFNHELGPFETWDALGVRPMAERMGQSGYAVPAWVVEMLAAGYETFYQYEGGRKTGFYDLATRRYQPLTDEA